MLQRLADAEVAHAHFELMDVAEGYCGIIPSTVNADPFPIIALSAVSTEGRHYVSATNNLPHQAQEAIKMIKYSPGKFFFAYHIFYLFKIVQIFLYASQIRRKSTK